MNKDEKNDQLLTLFEKTRAPQRAKQKSLAPAAHFLPSRAACLVLPLLLGICLSMSCAIWDGALDSSPQERGQWTMPSFQGELARLALGPISLLFPAFGQHLERRSWRMLGMAHIWFPSSLWKQTSFFANVEGNRMQKETLKPPGMRKRLAPTWGCFCRCVL